MLNGDLFKHCKTHYNKRSWFLMLEVPCEPLSDPNKSTTWMAKCEGVCVSGVCSAWSDQSIKLSHRPRGSGLFTGAGMTEWGEIIMSDWIEEIRSKGLEGRLGLAEDHVEDKRLMYTCKVHRSLWRVNAANGLRVRVVSLHMCKGRLKWRGKRAIDTNPLSFSYFLTYRSPLGFTSPLVSFEDDIRLSPWLSARTLSLIPLDP